MSQLLHVCLSLPLLLSPSESDAFPVGQAGVEKATERNTGNEQFEWSYHLFYNCWSNPIFCFVLWLSGRDIALGHRAIWLVQLVCCIVVSDQDPGEKPWHLINCFYENVATGHINNHKELLVVCVCVCVWKSFLLLIHARQNYHFPDLIGKDKNTYNTPSELVIL